MAKFMSINVDARGLACPQPVIATKKALDSIDQGIVTTIVDNAVAKENVVKFATANGYGVRVEEKDGHYYLTITKGQEAQTAGAAPAMAAATAGGPVYLLTGAGLGHGSSELGEVLMKSFLFTLTEKEPLPRAVLLMNGAVRLAVEGSPVLDHLRTLAAKGVAVRACGTCLDYFGLKEKLAVGEVTNMFAIVDEITSHQAITL
ncbi:sulfurtransferase-like selenium metabolism protein YedF [Sporolituus thermophilus]|uniref:Selenium metabolism protein YedF n=1 Tax=Sporolituus thermophilus DSM 23256 TaxID=1123285 RepID=A0A1G7L1I5_9FIRM|nr:sulfurtransferase-like selenium metabolism protein YedF [Sporolituus thermophilus]SDF43338.1 selenium metabolism protein YedF [Sporolituus thermophilus DSM 23256]